MGTACSERPSPTPMPHSLLSLTLPQPLLPPAPHTQLSTHEPLGSSSRARSPPAAPRRARLGPMLPPAWSTRATAAAFSGFPCCPRGFSAQSPRRSPVSLAVTAECPHWPQGPCTAFSNYPSDSTPTLLPPCLFCPGGASLMAMWQCAKHGPASGPLHMQPLCMKAPSPPAQGPCHWSAKPPSPCVFVYCLSTPSGHCRFHKAWAFECLGCCPAQGRRSVLTC